MVVMPVMAVRRQYIPSVELVRGGMELVADVPKLNSHLYRIWFAASFATTAFPRARALPAALPRARALTRATALLPLPLLLLQNRGRVLFRLHTE